MSFDYILLFLSLMFPLVFSPGPANIIFAISGMKQDFKKSISLLIGINLVFSLFKNSRLWISNFFSKISFFNKIYSNNRSDLYFLFRI